MNATQTLELLPSLAPGPSGVDNTVQQLVPRSGRQCKEARAVCRPFRADVPCVTYMSLESTSHALRAPGRDIH